MAYLVWLIGLGLCGAGGRRRGEQFIQHLLRLAQCRRRVSGFACMCLAGIAGAE